MNNRTLFATAVLSCLVFFLAFGCFENALAKSLIVEGELLEYDKKSERLVYNNPRVSFDQKVVMGNRLVYDKGKKKLVFSGNIIFRMPEVLLTADRIDFDIEAKKFTLIKATLYDQHSQTFVKAEKIETVSDDEFVIFDGSVTTCKPDQKAWEFKGGFIVYRINNFAYSYNTSLNFYQVPIFYSPFLSWPTKKGRASGLLPPSFTNQIGNVDKSKNYGKRLKIPYYLAIDKAQDLTLTADIIQLRGTATDLEYRYAFLEGMQGSLRGWYLDESVQERDLYHENLGDLPRDPDDPNLPLHSLDLRPTRYKLEYNHRQNIFFDGRLYLQLRQYSDSEVDPEYFDQEVFGADKTYQRIDLVYPWEQGDLTLGREIGRNFQFESLYDTSTEKDTRTQKGLYINLSHNFFNIADTPVSVSFDANSTQYIGEEGWIGKVSQLESSFSAPFKAVFLNLVPTYSRSFHHFDVLYETNGSAMDPGQPSFEPDPDPFHWFIDKKTLELNLEVFQIFQKNPKGGAGKLSFTPRILYVETDSVDQSQAIDYTSPVLGYSPDPERSITRSNSDYFLYRPLFEKATLGRRSIEYRLEALYLTKPKGSFKTRPLFHLILSQVYNLNRLGSIEEVETAKGPQIPEELQQTSLGNQKIPFEVSLLISPVRRFHAHLLNRYDHEEKRFTETLINLATSSPNDSRYGLEYSTNSKTYYDLNGDEHLAKSRYSIFHHLRLTDKVELYLRGEWDLNRNDLKVQYGENDFVKRLNSQLHSAYASFYYKHDCFQYIASYSETSKYQWIKGIQTEYMDRRFTFTFQIEGLPDSTNPYQQDYVL